MPGNKTGGAKAAATNKERYGEDFYKRIGAVGGGTPTNQLKGFAADRDMASRAGTIGGRKSRRGKSTAVSLTHGRYKSDKVRDLKELADKYTQTAEEAA